MTICRTVILIVAAFVQAACVVPATSLQPSSTSFPDRWHYDTAGVEPIARDWWRAFDSPEIDWLIERADRQSLDIDAALARVRQAAALARMAGASSLPELGGVIEVGRSDRIDDDSLVATESDYGVGILASYDLDLWGRNDAVREGARRTLRASVFDRDAVRLTIVTTVASTWLQLVSLRERAGIARLNLAAAQRLLALIEARARAGAASELELSQQRGLVAAQRRGVTSLQQQADDARVTINILLAETSGLESQKSSMREITVPAVAAGLPAELLTRRPDIARAEATLGAADADVLAARRAMLPNIALTSGIAAGGAHMNGIFDDPLFSLATAVTAPIFNAGRLAAERDFAIARREELLSNYRSAIVAAFGDVQRALNAIAGLDSQRLDQQAALVQAQRASTLAESRYLAGAETLLTLLDTQRTLYAAQDEAVQLKAARLQAQVGLYKALGGGWSKDAVPEGMTN